MPVPGARSISANRTTATSFANRSQADIDQNGLFPDEDIGGAQRFGNSAKQMMTVPEREEENDESEENVPDSEEENAEIEADEGDEDGSISGGLAQKRPKFDQRTYGIQYCANRRKVRRLQLTGERAQAPMQLPDPEPLPPARDLTERPSGGPRNRRPKKINGRSFIGPLPIGNTSSATLTGITSIAGYYLEHARRRFPHMFLPLRPEHCLFLQSTYADQPGKADSELVKIQARCRFEVMVDENKDSWTEEIYLCFAQSIMSTDATVTAKAHVGVLGRFTKYAKNLREP